MKLHRGERLIQTQAGRGEEIIAIADRVIRSALPAPHQRLLGRLPFIVVASQDPSRRIWASILTGQPGFIECESDTRLVIKTGALPGDALSQGLCEGTAVGLLGIDLAVRRRIRINGRIILRRAESITVQVQQSYGNCPKYIRPRQWQAAGHPQPPGKGHRSERLTAKMKQWIQRVDTFFIASGIDDKDEPAAGLDVSHRGGAAGFVQVVSDSELVFPDYSGNNLFNTLGNIVLNPQVALLFVDFPSGRLLQVSGLARINWDDKATRTTPGAKRLIHVSVEEAMTPPSCLAGSWQEIA